MSERNSGFFLLELLLSLSAWLMLGLFFVPLLIDITNQSKQVEIQRKATQLAFEELHAELSNSNELSSYSVFHDGIEYQINWFPTDLEKKEVCVQVEKNSFHAGTKVCKKSE